MWKNIQSNKSLKFLLKQKYSPSEANSVNYVAVVLTIIQRNMAEGRRKSK